MSAQIPIEPRSREARNGLSNAQSGPATIVVLGAGSIGCFVGGMLAASGARVVLLGRKSIVEELREHGLRLSDLEGHHRHLPAKNLRLATEPVALAAAGLIVVTVKSQATASAAAQIAAHARPDALVLSLQNGVRNAAELTEALPQHTVLAGMVPFNVVHQGEGRFHRATEGQLHAAPHAQLQRWLGAFEQAGLTLFPHPNLSGVLWGKLLLNLNNPVNALSGIPLKEELAQRSYRRCLALLQREALQLMQRAGIQPEKVAKVGPKWLPRLLGLPDWLFRRLAKRMLNIDPQARSSMWEDFEKGRPTEIDAINGEIVRLAIQLGSKAPANTRIVELVRAAEAGGRRDFAGDELLRLLRG